MKKWIIFLLVISPCTKAAVEDTSENRAKQAARYFAAVPVQSIVADYVDKMKPVGADGLKDRLVAIIEKTNLAADLQKTLVRDFTAAELEALADLASTPTGKSALRKHALFASGLSAAIQGAMLI